MIILTIQYSMSLLIKYNFPTEQQTRLKPQHHHHERLIRNTLSPRVGMALLTPYSHLTHGPLSIWRYVRPNGVLRPIPRQYFY